MLRLLLLLAFGLWNTTTIFAQPFALNDTAPVIERWMYANNAAPCDRPASSVFGTFGDAAGVDTRHAQHLIGWDTAAWISTNAGPKQYLVKRCRITLTINRGNLFAYDPTPDDYRTYFETNHPEYLPDDDAGRPVEMFGAAFRNGYDDFSFDQCALFGSNAPGERNGYAAGWSTNGALVDISNNVGKTNSAFPRFEVAPFAVGTTASVEPGQAVPTGAKVTFDLNLNDPFVLAYVQDALNRGRLRLMVTSLHVTEGQFGAPKYPDFATHFNEAALDPTRLELEGIAIRNADSDADGLPDDWEQFYFATLARNSLQDSDGDGMSNGGELVAGINPSSATSVLRLRAVRNPAGQPMVRFAHAASRRYDLEFTENFQSWRALTNSPIYLLGRGEAEWFDETSIATSRFYRLRVE
jgi:hypothetical protein